MATKVLSTSQAVIQELSAIKGARMVVITAKTEPAMIAGSPFKGNCFKLANVSGVINWNYEKAVNRQRGREGLPQTFQAMPRKWGRRLPKLPFVLHTLKSGQTKLYLELKVLKSLDHWYEDANGIHLDTVAVEAWLRPASPSRQNVSKEQVCRDYDMNNIVAIKGIDTGVTYVIEDNIQIVKDLAAIR